MTPDLERYSRQLLLPEIGEAGQRRLRASSMLVVGCGALGSNQAALLARAGVGKLRLVDRDLVQLANLHRQTLYDEDDAAICLPKAEAARRRLGRVNHEVELDSVVTDVTAGNVESLLDGVDVVLDGTDNAETRYLLNDACVKLGRPWIYGGAVASSGIVLPVLPGVGPCLRCVFEQPPVPGTLPTCDLVGVLNTVPALVGALQATEAIRVALGHPSLGQPLLALDVWTGSFRRLRAARNPDCPCCGQRRFEFLTGAHGSEAISLCGHSAVQVSPPEPLALDLELLATRLAALGNVLNNGLLLRFRSGEHDLVIFSDGRVIVHGTSDPAVARSLYARFIGS